MKIKEIALCVYIVASVAAIIGVVGNFDLLLLVSKPVIIPAVYFYYLAVVRKPNLIFTFFLIFTFIGDTVVLLKFDNPLFTMIPFFISYVILMKFIVHDAIKEKPSLANAVYASLLMFLLMFVFTYLIDIPDKSAAALLLPIVVYGVVLGTMVSLSTYNYLTYKTLSSYYLLIACGCSLISDVFYVLYNLHFHIPMLNYINVTMQFLSCFLFVKYMLCRKMFTSVKL